MDIALLAWLRPKNDIVAKQASLCGVIKGAKLAGIFHRQARKQSNLSFRMLFDVESVPP
jgi:hypothetical protein